MSDMTRRTSLSRLSARALRILSMRDHSEMELRRKLSSTCPTALTETQSPADNLPSSEQIEQILVWCCQHRYLDDARFTARFIASRSQKGDGPQRIRMALLQKGVEKPVIEDALQQTDIDWVQRALDVATRKFGLPLPATWQGKAKVQRYLLGKGFLSADIQQIFANFYL